ncbi:MAG: cobalt-factor II C(20)-methyltransferase [Euryarchaeota archaeon]|nr:cobalt-factor II C(20)-methyltransferase [Euryarchaeota archaeon]
MLIGLGLGPGDRDLLTLRAVKLLKGADAVFVPGKMAYELVEEYCKPEVLDYPMVDDEAVIADSLIRNAGRIAQVARSGTAVLGIIGDPSFYSTFSRQCEIMLSHYPDIEIDVQPGVSSITAFASRARLSINGGFIVTDGENPDSLIMLKVKRPREVVENLKDQGYKDFVLSERVFLDDERIYSADELPETSDYFSILYARK